MRDSEVLVIFVTANGEVLVRKIFRRSQNIIKCEGGKMKTKEGIKISNKNIYKIVFKKKI